MSRPSKAALLTAYNVLRNEMESRTVSEAQDGQDLILPELQEVADYLAEDLARISHSEYLDDNREEIERTQIPRDAEGRPLVTWAVFKRKAMAALMRERRRVAAGGDA